MLKKLGLLICISINCLSQTSALSSYEKCWAVFHPFAAIRVNKIGKQLLVLHNDPSLRLTLDSSNSGGRLDAFRHVFYMAAFAQKVKVKKIRKLGRAHEKANYKQFRHAQKEEGEVPDSLSSVMDLSNNELGFAIGSKNKTMPLPALKELVIQHILDGKALVMKRNKKGNYVTCGGRELPAQLPRQWNLPKCLVASSLAYSD